MSELIGADIRPARSRFRVRRILPVVAMCAAVQLVAATPAFAWFDWLDQLSGPGPFWGAEFTFRVACLMDQPPASEAVQRIRAVQTLMQSLAALQPPPPQVPGNQDTFSLPYVRQLAALEANVADMVKDPTLRKESLKTAADLQTQFNEFAKVLGPPPPPPPPVPGPSVLSARSPAAPAVTLDALRMAVYEAQESLREIAVPRVATGPGLKFWASCSDPSRHEPAAANGMSILRRHRHPRFSFLISYRETGNGVVTLPNFYTFHFREHPNGKYADGEPISLRIVEGLVSWPFSGRHDVLDGQLGVGGYFFKSSGIESDPRGVFFEPFRLDVHFPSRFSDPENLSDNIWLRVLERVPLSLSYRLGLEMFLTGLSGDDPFNANPADPTALTQFSRNEAVFHQAVVLNVGRIFGW